MKPPTKIRSHKSERLLRSFTTEIPLFRKKKGVHDAVANRTRHVRPPFCLLFRSLACQKSLVTSKLSTNQTKVPLARAKLTGARGFQIWHLALNIRKLWTRVTRFNPYGFLIWVNCPVTLQFYISPVLNLFILLSKTNEQRNKKKKWADVTNTQPGYVLKILVDLSLKALVKKVLIKKVYLLSCRPLILKQRWFLVNSMISLVTTNWKVWK